MHTPSLPSSHPDMPVRAVVFASEQLVPALQFLLHAAEHFGPRLASIHIYHTDDAKRSAEPARRLQALLLRWGRPRGLTPDVRLACGDQRPADVRRALTDWFLDAPQSLWLVNVTGGTKPMSAAAAELTLATDLEARRVLYQEIGGGWSELLPDADGLLDMHPLDAATDAVVPPPDTLERLLPVSALVATQFSAEHAVSADTLPDALPVDTLTERLLANRWRWQDALASLPRPVRCTSNGVGFELYLGTGLRDSGLHLRHSLKVCEPGPGGKPVREIDLVGCHRGRLICIDIKLPGAEEHAKGTQLADVAELAHSLGGRGALAVAVRPGWPADAGTQRLAHALGVRLLTQAEAARPFSTILGWIDRNLQPAAAVQIAEGLLQARQTSGSDVLSDGRLIDAITTNDAGMLHLPTMLEQISQRRGEPWALVQLIPPQYWLGIPKKLAPITQTPDWPQRSEQLRQLMRRCSDPDNLFQFRESAAWVTVLFSTRPGLKRDDLLQQLRPLLQPDA